MSSQFEYCCVSDVASEFRDITFDDNSVVTKAEVNEFISRQSAIIDGILSTKYTVPITGTISLIIMKELCALMVAGKVDRILRLRTGEKGQNSGRDFAKEAKDIMDKLLKDVLVLSDADAKNQSRITSYNVANSIEPVMEKETDQW